MKRFIIFYFFHVAVFSGDNYFYQWRKISHDDDKIIGGIATNINMYPYQALLVLFDGLDYYQCGGSIISDKHIVTAAHCLIGIEIIFIRIGSSNSRYGGYKYRTLTFYQHPSFDSSSMDFDVGIVEVPRKMRIDGVTSSTINIVNEGYNLQPGEKLILTGWGSTYQHGPVSHKLMVVVVPVISRALCNMQHKGDITDRMICAGIPEGGKDTCQGDSGGPAVVASDNLLVGITSFGYGCARPKSPGVYTFLGNKEIRKYIRLMTGV